MGEEIEENIVSTNETFQELNEEETENEIIKEV